MNGASAKNVLKRIALLLAGYFLLLTMLAALVMNGTVGEGRIGVGCLVAAGALALADAAIGALRKRSFAENAIGLCGFLAATVLLGFLICDATELLQAGKMLLVLLLGSAAGTLLFASRAGRGNGKRRKRRAMK